MSKERKTYFEVAEGPDVAHYFLLSERVEQQLIN